MQIPVHPLIPQPDPGGAGAAESPAAGAAEPGSGGGPAGGDPAGGAPAGGAPAGDGPGPAAGATPVAGAADGDDKQRLRAALRELERAKQRVERDAARVAAQTRDDLLARLLPLLDDLDRTIAAAPPGDLRDGVALVRDKFERVLADYGLERVPTVGHRFDPAVHEAVGVAPVAPDRDGEVVSEWQRGYRAGDRVLRAAKVVVGRAA